MPHFALPDDASPTYDAAFMTARASPRQPNLREKSQLMSASEIERTLVRLAHEIAEKNEGAVDLGLVGIRRRGVPLAQRLGQIIERIEKSPVPILPRANHRCKKCQCNLIHSLCTGPHQL